MATGQKLRGLVGQAMAGTRKAVTPLSYIYPPGSYTFRPTKPGWYRFAAWGPGGATVAAVSSGGALVVANRLLSVGQSVALVVGAADVSAPVNTTITLPSGEVLTAGAGVEGAAAAGGVASGNTQLGDILVNGGPAGAGLAGVGATSGNYLGGGVPASGASKAPAGGGTAGSPPGDGLVLIHQIRLRP